MDEDRRLSHEPLSVIAHQREIIQQQQDRINALESLAQSRADDLAVATGIATQALQIIANRTNDTKTAATAVIVKAA